MYNDKIQNLRDEQSKYESMLVWKKDYKAFKR